MSVFPRIGVGLVLVALACARLGASPDHEVKVVERLLGTSADGFAILRVETDNLGSYYNSREKQFLDLYAKSGPEEMPDVAVKRSSTLLLDQGFSRHPDTRPDEPSVVTVHEMEEVGDEVSLPSLLKRFPMMPVEWEKEKFERLEALPRPGVRLGHYNLIWGGWVTERFGLDRNDPLDWKLEKAAEDGNSLFLKVSSENQIRWICIPPQITAQVNARLLLKEFYLLAGAFDSAEGAIGFAREMNPKRNEGHVVRFTPEVWSEDLPTLKIRYLVVSGLTAAAVQPGLFSKLEETLGVDLEVCSANRFKEQIFFDMEE